MNMNAMYSLTYGLFVLTAKDGKDNGCIINTPAQVTTSPNRITIAVNKGNYTHDMIRRTGVFNISILDESAPFSLFRRFGFASGRDTDKLEGLSLPRSENGVVYLTDHACAYISGSVVAEVDLGTHTLFLADVTDCEVLSDSAPVTYAYYHANIKPKPQAQEKTVWVCKICGYTHEGDQLPDDFVCPWCKHGAIDFEKKGG